MTNQLPMLTSLLDSPLLHDPLRHWPSPAKLNLFLHITGRRPDGYHNLQSLFQLLDKGDVLHFAYRNDQKLVLETPIENVPNENNLIVKAAKLLQDKYQPKQGISIWLDKHLPMGGGIGGGSSNAATTLVALNYLWRLNLPKAELMQLGLQLGADVPVFVNGTTAFAEGVGEKLIATESSEKVYLVVNPSVHVSTADIFSASELPRNTPPIAWQDYKFDRTHNDCQTLVISKYPVIAKSLQWLLQYAPSRMTGTGSSLFAVFDDVQSAQLALQQKPEYCSAFIADGCNKSPLMVKLDGLMGPETKHTK